MEHHTLCLLYLGIDFTINDRHNNSLRLTFNFVKEELYSPLDSSPSAIIRAVPYILLSIIGPLGSVNPAQADNFL